MYSQARMVFPLLLVATLALILPACGGGGGSSPPPPFLDSADFIDSNVNGALDTGDIIIVGFTRAVTVQGTPVASAVFTLPVAGDDLGASTVVAGLLPEEVVIQIATGASILPDGVFDPAIVTPGSPSGIDVLGGQTGLTFGSNRQVPTRNQPVDIGGSLSIGGWTTVANTLNNARFGHTATLLPNGEILLVGGLHDVASGVTPMLRQTLASIEVFDPVTETFTLAADSLVNPRGYHKAVRTPGRDGNIDTNDDYVVILGGWSDRFTDSAGGPRSEGSLEVIRPDWNGDGDTSDLVVNPNTMGIPTGAVLDDLGTATLPVDMGCAGTTVGIGFHGIDMQWVPGAGIVDPLGNNELLIQGGFQTMQWDECQGGLSLFFIWFSGTFSPPNCENGVPYIAVDPNNDGDLSDSGIYQLTLPGSPLTGPVALTRGNYAQVRVAGPDGVDGTTDDAQIMYGGFGMDLIAVCNSLPVNQCPLADLEYFDLAQAFLYTGVRNAYSTCGLACGSPGGSPTDRGECLVAVPTGSATQEVVLLGGAGSNATVQPCTQAVEVITPNFATPSSSTVRYGGLEALPNRWFNHSGSLLPGNGNVLLAGGVDNDAGGTTDSVEYVQVAMDQVMTVAAMSEPRDSHAAVSFPAGYAGLAIPQDRVYIFGGVNRASTYIMVIGDPVIDVATASNTAEYFIE